ncbi:MAG: glycosyltransferase 87 family protein [Candidatus Limnocylindria bacterium]
MPLMLTLAIHRAALAIALGSCALIAFGNVFVVSIQWPFDDTFAYLGAAERLLAGESPYTSVAPTSELYRYSPWFAAAWIPMTLLPDAAVEVIWLGILALSFVAALWPYRRGLGAVCLGLLLGGLLYRTLGWGNVQPLLVALLVWQLPTRAGPWVLGVVGSLKPLALAGAVVFAWRREWWSAFIALAVAAVLWAPALLFDLSGYPAVRSINLFDATFLLAAAPLWLRSAGPARPG